MTVIRDKVDRERFEVTYKESAARRQREQRRGS
jgi:hypothetical protein